MGCREKLLFILYFLLQHHLWRAEWEKFPFLKMPQNNVWLESFLLACSPVCVLYARGFCITEKCGGFKQNSFQSVCLVLFPEVGVSKTV